MRNGGTDGIERSVTWKQHAHMHKQKQKRSASEECCHKAHLHFPGKVPVASYSQVIKSLWLFNLVLSQEMRMEISAKQPDQEVESTDQK